MISKDYVLTFTHENTFMELLPWTHKKSKEDLRLLQVNHPHSGILDYSRWEPDLLTNLLRKLIIVSFGEIQRGLDNTNKIIYEIAVCF